MDEDERIEAVAQLIHEARHPLGTAQICDSCRRIARSVDVVYRRFPVER
jgi:hypothetical protein